MLTREVLVQRSATHKFCDYCDDGTYINDQHVARFPLDF